MQAHVEESLLPEPVRLGRERRRTAAQIEELEAVLGYNPRRPEARPLCGRNMRDGHCNMKAGHRGRCTTQAWTCDGCGRTQRGTPTARDPEAGSFCFLCAPPRYADLSRNLRGTLDWW